MLGRNLVVSLVALISVACGPAPEALDGAPLEPAAIEVSVTSEEADAGEIADAGELCSHGYTDAGECDDSYLKAAPPGYPRKQ